MLPRHAMEAFVKFLLRFRWPVIAAVTVFTLFLGYHFRNMRVYTNFFDLYPPRHEYIKLYNKYRRMFGTANILVMSLEAKDGSIFDVESINLLDRMTQDVLTTPGVNPWQILSITHPNMKNIKITGAAISSYPIMYPSAPKTPQDVVPMKKAVYTNEGVRGYYVSEDDSSALIVAGFWEEGVDFTGIYDRMLQIRQYVEASGQHQVYIAGFPMLYSWVFSYKNAILGIIGVTVVIMVLLLWFYFRTTTGVWVPLFSGGISAFWALGFAGFFGFNLDPLVLVALIVITARALSHSVQSMERYHEEYHRLKDKQQAILVSYIGVFSPALVSIATDGAGVFTLAIAHVPLIQKLAYVSSFWIATISLSVVTLHPIILSLIPPPPEDPKAGKRFSDKLYSGVNRNLVKLARGTPRYVIVATMVVVLMASAFYSHQLKIGDVSIGKALLYPDHDYNVSYDRINEKFVGVSQLVVIAAGTENDVLKDDTALVTLERFQKHMEKQELVGGSLTITNLVRNLYQQFQEGVPKWAIIPDNPRDVGNLIYTFVNNVGVDVLDRFLDKDSRNATITVYYKDYTHDTVVGSIEQAKEFIEANPLEKIEFKLAGGLLGILAAVNEEVEWSYKWNLILVLVTVFILSLLTYASVVGALIVMIPSIVAQPLSEALMYIIGIDANINSLPVAAIGIGIGIDYGYYVLSRIVEEYGRFQDYDQAIEEALMTTGRAIMFTGTTLVASIIFWVLFPMKFQAEMAILLALLLFFHVVGALAFIPGTVSLLKPRFPLPNEVMGAILITLTVAGGVLLYFDLVNLVSLAALALIAAVIEYYYARRKGFIMELKV